MATIAIRLSESDKELFTNVSKEKNKTLSDWARESLLEKIEQEYDEKIVDEYLLNKGKMKFYSDDEVKKELGIWGLFIQKKYILKNSAMLFVVTSF